MLLKWIKRLRNRNQMRDSFVEWLNANKDELEKWREESVEFANGWMLTGEMIEASFDGLERLQNDTSSGFGDNEDEESDDDDVEDEDGYEALQRALVESRQIDEKRLTPSSQQPYQRSVQEFLRDPTARKFNSPKQMFIIDEDDLCSDDEEAPLWGTMLDGQLIEANGDGVAEEEDDFDADHEVTVKLFTFVDEDEETKNVNVQDAFVMHDLGQKDKKKNANIHNTDNDNGTSNSDTVNRLSSELSEKQERIDELEQIISNVQQYLREL